MKDISLVLQSFDHDAELKIEIYRVLKLLIQFTPYIPHPAQNETYKRWRILSLVAQTNLSLAKLFESHLDAISILHELNIQLPINDQKKLWAVWAAEGGNSPLVCHEQHVSGIKPWCSASKHVDFGLMTYRDDQQRSQLFRLDLQQQGIEHVTDQWNAVGMQHTQTNAIHFNNVPIKHIGEPNQYLSRVGFWHGAAGVAACWFGAALGLADYLKRAAEMKPHLFKAMYLGEVLTDIVVTKSALKQLAEQIDQQPLDSHELEVRAVRAHVERVCFNIIEKVGKALGAAPFCQNAHFAQLMSDLPVFIRQSHAAFDLVEIGQLSIEDPDIWLL